MKLLKVFIEPLFVILSTAFIIGILWFSSVLLFHVPTIRAEDEKFPPLGGYIQQGSEGVSVTSSVKKNKENYEYLYEIKNIGKKKSWLVGNSGVDYAIGLIGGQDEVTHLYNLSPGQSSIVRITSKNRPVERQGLTFCYNKEFIIDDWYKKCNVQMLGVEPMFYFQMAGGTSVWGPKKENEIR